MSTTKSKKFTWGGKRPGTGRPKGSGEKTKICVSVNRDNWHAALSKWRKKKRREKKSWLVDWLLADFINKELAAHENN